MCCYLSERTSEPFPKCYETACSASSIGNRSSSTSRTTIQPVSEKMLSVWLYAMLSVWMYVMLAVWLYVMLFVWLYLVLSVWLYAMLSVWRLLCACQNLSPKCYEKACSTSITTISSLSEKMLSVWLYVMLSVWRLLGARLNLLRADKWVSVVAEDACTLLNSAALLDKDKDKDKIIQIQRQGQRQRQQP